MIQTAQYYDMASLAEAAYVLFDEINFLNKEEVKAALQKDAKKGGAFSATQAQEFVDKWEVVSHHADTDSIMDEAF